MSGIDAALPATAVPLRETAAAPAAEAAAGRDAATARVGEQRPREPYHLRIEEGTMRQILEVLSPLTGEVLYSIPAAYRPDGAPGRALHEAPEAGWP